MDAGPITVLVVDDHAPFRLAARAVIGRAQGFHVVAEAETGEEAVELAARVEPALVLMDIKMPGMNGLEATRCILSKDPGTVVFLCSTYKLADVCPDAADSGAAAYLDKDELGPAVLRRLWEQHARPG